MNKRTRSATNGSNKQTGKAQAFNSEQTSLVNINSNIASLSNSLVVYDNYSGNPIQVTYIGNRWWVTSPREKLQPLEEYFDSEDVSFFTLCEAGGTVGALALARMLGHALENPEDDVTDVMHWRVAELNRLGITFDLWDEPLLMELDVFPNGQNSCRNGKFSVMCYAKGACNECLFNIDGFDSKKDAEEWARFYFEYLEQIGIRFTII